MAPPKPAAQNLQVVISPEKIAPRLCNIVNFAKLRGGAVLMSFIFKDPTLPHAHLLERFLIDQDHAKQIVSVLSSILKK